MTNAFINGFYKRADEHNMKKADADKLHNNYYIHPDDEAYERKSDKEYAEKDKSSILGRYLSQKSLRNQSELDNPFGTFGGGMIGGTVGGGAGALGGAGLGAAFGHPAAGALGGGLLGMLAGGSVGQRMGAIGNDPHKREQKLNEVSHNMEARSPLQHVLHSAKGPAVLSALVGALAGGSFGDGSKAHMTGDDRLMGALTGAGVGGLLGGASGGIHGAVNKFVHDNTSDKTHALAGKMQAKHPYATDMLPFGDVAGAIPKR
jgi:hypothetical protein